MPEPATNADDRQPGGSERHGTCHHEDCYCVCPACKSEPGGSGAGSTVDLFFMGKPAPEEHDIVAAQRVIAQLRAALEAAQRENERLRMLGQTFTNELTDALMQSRATEAELRNSRGAVAAENGRLRGALREIADGTHPLEMVRVARRALDATEQPARAEEGQG